MTDVVDLVGKRFDRLLVVARAASNNGAQWECVCDCGERRIVRGSELRNGKRRSCGCWRRDMQIEMRARRSRNSICMRSGKKTATYFTWTNMKTRCLNAGNENFAGYGGRGIRICDRWLNSFENFVADMGEKPEGMSIDRIDVNGNYEPGNCRWATVNEQARNTRAVRLTPEVQAQIVELRSQGLYQHEVARRLGITQACVSDFECGKTWRPEGVPKPPRKRNPSRPNA